MGLGEATFCDNKHILLAQFNSIKRQDINGWVIKAAGGGQAGCCLRWNKAATEAQTQMTTATQRAAAARETGSMSLCLTSCLCLMLIQAVILLCQCMSVIPCFLIISRGLSAKDLQVVTSDVGPTLCTQCRLCCSHVALMPSCAELWYVMGRAHLRGGEGHGGSVWLTLWDSGAPVERRASSTYQRIQMNYLFLPPTFNRDWHVCGAGRLKTWESDLRTTKR